MFIYDGEDARHRGGSILGHFVCSRLEASEGAKRSNKFAKVNKDKNLMVHLPDVFLKH